MNKSAYVIIRIPASRHINSVLLDCVWGNIVYRLTKYTFHNVMSGTDTTGSVYTKLI